MARLRFKYGTMGSSKSMELLLTHFKYTQQNRPVLVFKPQYDTRNEGEVFSRATGERIKCISVPKDSSSFMFDKVVDYMPECILVDECQFLTVSQVEELSTIVDMLGVQVLAFGLLTDFQSHLFPASQRFIELGAEITEIENLCQECGKPATHNLRYLGASPIFEGAQIEVESLSATKTLNTDKASLNTVTKNVNIAEAEPKYAYKAVCRSCYNTARTNTRIKALQ